MHRTTLSQLHDDARRRHAAGRRLRLHAGLFALVSLALLLIDQLTTPGIQWAAYPIIGWGLGVGVHLGAVGYALADAPTEANDAELDRLIERRR
jgi:hypothetical protein